jgi:hypothetical protein
MVEGGNWGRSLIVGERFFTWGLEDLLKTFLDTSLGDGRRWDTLDLEVVRLVSTSKVVVVTQGRREHGLVIASHSGSLHNPSISLFQYLYILQLLMQLLIQPFQL